ncbi:SCP2 sterol-binding domain-containing protein [Actinomadura barringtoniae]|uniref:SCP2 sterol-binding domain-containing protein n=1 Tax=Actinomadura barringtoniae TaxID=1427535 RepID=A0A939PI22_9ACTN|nr:SCP2 sterol-binding domain-containing protein [Actinomadura barringtoniae]MBO2450194.1 SCP2 sterol-binding domain-containing protein [Actinomadura barringtoniae]
MANEEECRAALGRIAGRLGDVDPEQLAEHVVERSISCRIPDLGVAYRTRIHKDGLDEFEPTDDAKGAQVRLTVNSDDLVALANDELSPAKAWASGKLKIEASIFDLLRLRKLL